jgi:hypothetical protein
MAGFTPGQRDQLIALLKGAGGRRKNGKKQRTNPTPGSALLAEARQIALDAVSENDTIPLTKLERIVNRHWQELTEEQRRFLADKLARSGFPGKDAGAASLLNYCAAELKKSDRRVTQISEAAMQLVEDILNEGGVRGKNTVYELVVEKIDTGAWQEAGLLKLLGYKVGKSGLGLSERRAILRDAYRVSLVPGSAEVAEYLRSWGAPLSQQRLDKVTGSIGSFMSLARNQRSDYSAALADWQADLDWLRRSS